MAMHKHAPLAQQRSLLSVDGGDYTALRTVSGLMIITIQQRVAYTLNNYDTDAANNLHR